MPLTTLGLTLLLAISTGEPPNPGWHPIDRFEQPPAALAAEAADQDERIGSPDAEGAGGWSTEDTVKGVVDVAGRGKDLVPTSQPDGNKPAAEIAGAVAEEGGSRFRRLLRPALKLGLLGLAGLAVVFGVVAAVAGGVGRFLTAPPAEPATDRPSGPAAPHGSSSGDS